MDLIKSLSGERFQMDIRRRAFSNTVIGSCSSPHGRQDPEAALELTMTDKFMREALIVFLTDKDADLCASKTTEKVIFLKSLRIVLRKENCLVCEINEW